jgi:hypothetical protein
MTICNSSHPTLSSVIHPFHYAASPGSRGGALTTISAVIFTFARNVAGRYGDIATPPSMGGMAGGSSTRFLLAGSGIVLSIVSLVWTWGNGARLSKRLSRRPCTLIQAAHMLRRAIRIGVLLNLIGLAVTLVAAEEIVGSLAIKVLTNQRVPTPGAYMAPMEGLQPLDILIVQAITNTLLSHFCSLVGLLFLTDRVAQLDPPSEE